MRGPRALARVRALWYARDRVAARRDIAPGRILPDAAIVVAAEADPADERALLGLPGFAGRSVRRLARTWLAALRQARELPEDALGGNFLSAGWEDVATAVHVSAYSYQALAMAASPRRSA